jgi:NADPH:quinone reductase-like Zn-dependent oxidoreductase
MAMMRAVVIEAYGHFSQAHEAQVPMPSPKAGEVLIRVESALVGHYDYVLMSGIFGTHYQLPFVPGVEGAGTVVECGESAEALMGKRVQAMGIGLWAEYVVAKADQVVPLLDDVSFDQAAALCGNPATVLMFRDYIRAGGHKAVVQNAANSSLGKMLIRLCRHEGVPLINIVRSAKSAEAIRAEGADNVLDSSDANFLTDYKAACTRLNATIAFDAVAGDMTGTVLSGLCPGGVVYVYGGLSEQPSNGIQASDIIFLGKRVEGRNMPGWLVCKSAEEKRKLYSDIQDMMETVFRSDFIGHYSLEQLQEALETYKGNMSAGKLLLHPNQH